MRFRLAELKEEVSEVFTAMDPRLQRIAIRAKAAGDEDCEIPVIARVSDASAWLALPGVKAGFVLPMEDGAGEAAGEAIVTGRIPARAIERVRRHWAVRSLKASHPVRARLRATVPDLGVDAMPPASAASGGQGVIVGLVDFGFDFAHSNFRNADGSTRALGIWDQNAAAAPAGTVPYGRFYTPDEINAALAQADPYTVLGYQVAASDADGQGTHGTHVMDIAAGNGLGSGQPGLAPQAALLFVELSASAGIGDSVHLVEAVQFLFNMAGARPCVVNLSLGENLGPHDGTTLVELALDRFVEQQPNRCVVVAAGNSFSEGIHASGQVAQGGVFDLAFTVPDDDPVDHKLEIWYAGADRFSVEILANGQSLLTFNPGETKTLTQAGVAAIVAASRLNDPNNHDNQIEIFLDKGLEAATWTVRLSGVTVASGGFHAWLERDDNGAQFAAPRQDESHTLGSLASGRNTIVVGAYDAHTPGSPIFFDSSAGPTRDGRNKPEVSAPGVNVIAACARTGTGVVSRLGTSMAAPAVAGTAALLLAEAQAQDKTLTGAAIRDLLVATARVNPGPAGVWDPRYGNGRVSAAAADAQLLPGAAAVARANA